MANCLIYSTGCEFQQSNCFHLFYSLHYHNSCLFNILMTESTYPYHYYWNNLNDNFFINFVTVCSSGYFTFIICIKYWEDALQLLQEIKIVILWHLYTWLSFRKYRCHYLPESLYALVQSHLILSFLRGHKHHPEFYVYASLVSL